MHAVKGNAANIGGMRLMQVCREAESAGLARFLRDPVSLLGMLRQTFEQTLASLHELVETTRGEHRQPVGGGPGAPAAPLKSALYNNIILRRKDEEDEEEKNRRNNFFEPTPPPFFSPSPPFLQEFFFLLGTGPPPLSHSRHGQRPDLFQFDLLNIRRWDRGEGRGRNGKPYSLRSFVLP